MSWLHGQAQQTEKEVPQSFPGLQSCVLLGLRSSRSHPDSKCDMACCRSDRTTISIEGHMRYLRGTHPAR